jgi:hypothetical protein
LTRSNPSSVLGDWEMATWSLVYWGLMSASLFSV